MVATQSQPCRRCWGRRGLRGWADNDGGDGGGGDGGGDGDDDGGGVAGGDGDDYVHSDDSMVVMMCCLRLRLNIGVVERPAPKNIYT